MSDALAVGPEPIPPAAKTGHVVTKDGKRKQIAPGTKRAIDFMVYEGMPWDQAADAAKVTRRGLRKALELPHVIQYLRQQRQVFRAHAAAANIHRAVQIRSQDDNKTAAIQAIRYLDGISEQESTRADGRTVSPGVVVTVNVQRGPAEVDQTVIEVGNAAAPDSQSGD